MKKKKRPLNPQQLKFVQEYIIFGNASEAARRAGYAEQWVGKIGPALLGNSRIVEEINRQTKKVLSHRDVTKERILTELARVGFTSMDDLAEWGGAGVTLKDSKNVSRDKKAAVKELVQKKGNTDEIKIGLHDKVRALDTLAKYIGIEKTGDKKNTEIKLKYNLEEKK